jgi:hypothetical protein
MKNKISSEEDKIFKIRGDGTVIRADETSSHSELERELLEIVEVNSYSKKILAAYRGRKLANKICKKKYGKANYKEYVEMLMVKHFPKEHEKSELGAKYIVWRNFLIYCFPINIFFIWAIWTILIPVRRNLKNCLNEQ